MQNIINSTYIENAHRWGESFQAAQPFRHCLMTHFLREEFMKAILDEFPVPANPQDLRNEFGGKSKKHAVHDIRELGGTFRHWDAMLQSAPFIKWLSQITGIEGLLFDPEYHGAGTHNNLHGQGMDVHVDFNFHRTTRYHRRLNLIIYLNKEWEDEWGGGLSLHKDPWDPETDEWKTYPCLANHAILFETNEVSWHGFEEINLPADKRHLSRKSLTVYYYSKERPNEEIASKHSTIYVQKPIPPHIMPGTTITATDHVVLRKIIKKRNRYLKGMYSRESRLLERIENFKYRMRQHEENQRLPIIGFVRQLGAPKGNLPNQKVYEDLYIKLESVRAVNRIRIRGTVPAILRKNRLTIKIDTQIIAEQKLISGIFDHVMDFDAIPADSIFELTCHCDQYVSPKEMGINQDATKVGFILTELIFDHVS
ncbi:MAG: 2OG-Fe(II) oxygenase [Saprospiraceae bacterium]|nr:2OG-Fe(II) oxygenase [Saprospiraceae bacterium]